MISDLFKFVTWEMWSSSSLFPLSEDFSRVKRTHLGVRATSMNQDSSLCVTRAQDTERAEFKAESCDRRSIRKDKMKERRACSCSVLGQTVRNLTN